MPSKTSSPGGLDAEGRRFLDGRVCAGAIERVRGTPARAPIRVYVGLHSAPTIAERVRAALSELGRLGAFERRRIVVGSPTGLGWLNPTAVEAEEIMSAGDVATVVVQYAEERSWRSRRRVPVGRDTHRALLEALGERTGGDDRPELAVFAESLGAWAALSALGGPDDLDRLGVARGLWVGVPFDARDHQRRVVPTAPAQPDPRFGVFASAAELDAEPSGRRRALRFTFLTRRDDPVATFEGARVLYAPPRNRRAGEPWLPLVSALRSLRDIVRATDFAPGHLGATGHDYRGELAAAVRTAFGHEDVGAEELGRIEAELLERERRRAAHDPRGSAA